MKCTATISTSKSYRLEERDNEMNSVDSGFQQILTAAKERRGDLTVDTMIVSSHLAQMRMFILRRGIEFFAEQR